MIELYTDGACLGNPGGPGGWGAVMVGEDGSQTELAGGEPRTTNQRMEITAVIKGLEQTPAGARVRVVSDSQYVIKTMTQGWQRNANQDLWNRLDALVKDRRATWEWVRGHNGHPFNELADSLATGAARDMARKGSQGALAPAEATPPSEPEVRSKVPRRTAAAAARATGPEQPVEPVAREGLTHVDGSGKSRMVDVGGKEVTERVAVAKGAVVMQQETLEKIRANAFEKGDVLGTSKIAGVMAAKRTHELIPLCHPIPLTQVLVELDADSAADRVEITATARATWKTGVEMEALTAVTVAALTVYDMCKAVDRGMRIEAVRLVRKSGGKSGDYVGE